MAAAPLRSAGPADVRPAELPEDPPFDCRAELSLLAALIPVAPRRTTLPRRLAPERRQARAAGGMVPSRPRGLLPLMLVEASNEVLARHAVRANRGASLAEGTLAIGDQAVECPGIARPSDRATAPPCTGRRRYHGRLRGPCAGWGRRGGSRRRDATMCGSAAWLVQPTASEVVCRRIEAPGEKRPAMAPTDLQAVRTEPQGEWTC